MGSEIGTIVAGSEIKTTKITLKLKLIKLMIAVVVALFLLHSRARQITFASIIGWPIIAIVNGIKRVYMFKKLKPKKISITQAPIDVTIQAYRTSFSGGIYFAKAADVRAPMTRPRDGIKFKRPYLLGLTPSLFIAMNGAAVAKM